MKKFTVCALFTLLLFGAMVQAKESNTALPRFFDVKNVAFQKDDHISFFEAENWWLKKYPDITNNSSYFYAPLPSDKLFAGIYLRFQNDRLNMVDYIVKDNTSKDALNKLFTSLGKTVMNKELGVKTVTKKNGTLYIAATGQRPYRLIAVSAATKDLSLVKAHLNVKRQQTQKN